MRVVATGRRAITARAVALEERTWSRSRSCRSIIGGLTRAPGWLKETNRRGKDRSVAEALLAGPKLMLQSSQALCHVWTGGRNALANISIGASHTRNPLLHLTCRVSWPHIRKLLSNLAVPCVKLLELASAGHDVL